MINNLNSEEREGEAQSNHMYTSFVPLPTGGSLVKQLNDQLALLDSYKHKYYAPK